MFDTVWTRYAEAKMLDAVFINAAIGVAAANWRVGLMKLKGGVDPAQIPGRDDVVEIDAGANPSYARQPLGVTTLAAPNGGTPYRSNDAAFQYPEAQEAWGTVAALGLFDGGGNLWAVVPSAVGDRRTVRVGDRITIPAGQFVVTGYSAPV